MVYLRSMLLMIFLFPLHLFCQEDDTPKRSIGISAGKGFTLQTSKKELKASSFELFAGPGLRNSKHSRWAAQFGFVYSRRDFTNGANSDEPAGLIYSGDYSIITAGISTFQNIRGCMLMRDPDWVDYSYVVVQDSL